MAEALVLVARPLDHVAVVTINRPETSNAISPAVAQAMDHVVRDVEAEPTIRAVVLTGAGGRAFCAGADLKALAAGERDALYTPGGGFAGFADAPRVKCWIAAVEGAALAGGLEIALACDIIVAGAGARFGLPEVSRGLVAAAGGLYRLPRRIGRGPALEMIATGRAIDAERAHALGLADHLVSTGDATAFAYRIAAAIAANAPNAVRESLAVARRYADEPAATLRAASLEAAARNAATDDFREGPRAFLEKRAPVWTGR